MDTLDNSLAYLGLSDKQIAVYKALLEVGRGSAQRIAKNTNLKRTTVYSVLNELQELGLVHIIPDSSRKYYRPLSPSFLIEKQEQKLRLASKAVPEIEAHLKSTGSDSKPNIKFYEGVNGIKHILNYKIEEMAGKTVCIFYATAGGDVQKEFDYFKEYEKKRVKFNIQAKGVVPDDPENLERYRKEDMKALREIKVLPKEVYSSNIAIEIGDDWVKTNDFKNLQGLIIENEAFAKTMREIFEMVWNNVKGK